MKKVNSAERDPIIKYMHRLLAMFLCLIMVFSLCDKAIIILVRAIDSFSTTIGQEETKAEIKARIMRQIRNENWDPYSSDMTIEEFYALMELFEEGKLPLKSSSTQGSPWFGAPGFDEPGIDEPSTGSSSVSIPREMFMYSGLSSYSGDNQPLPYFNSLDDETLRDEPEDYPAGLDNYGVGYMRPPKSWSGVQVNGEMDAVVIVPSVNDDDSAVAGDVDQTLFQNYDGYYVRRVTAQDMEVTILGAIRLSGGDYVYYYLTSDSQSTDVSTTTLAKGKKFIVQYSVSEHTVDYKLYMDGINSTTALPDGVTLDTVFGADRPAKTDAGKYAFTATAPYGYTLELYLIKEEDEATKGEPITLLGLDSKGALENEVNEGWALGKEPDYINGTKVNATILPNTDNGPSTFTASGTVYNNDVHHDRTVIGVLKAKPEPTFLVAPIYHNTDNVSSRGSSAVTTITAKNNATGATETIPYDYEDVYLWASGSGSSKYDYTNSSFGNSTKPNLQVGNIASGDNWGWQGRPPYTNTVMMNKEADGTYSYQWTWQTNTGSGGYTLDSLEINGVGITLPFFPKYSLRNDYKIGTNGGGTTWYTETDIGNGTHIKVELLMVFNPGGDQQRVYRITATGARSDVVISSMNLIMGTGAPEFSAYKLDGITDGTGTASVEYYINSNYWRSIPQGTIAIDTVENGVNVGINYTGDAYNYGANIRFKLADGYDSPYYLWESPQNGVVDGQASIDRDPVTGEVIPSTKKTVKPLSEASGTLDSQYIYGPDDEGYYYIRVSTQNPYKFVLLTVVALPVRYVVRYVPSYSAIGETAPEDTNVGIIDNPGNMPEFTHYRDTCHESFRNPTNGIPDEQYDDKDGEYYDTAVDTVVILPANFPTDPNNKYGFVDWVLVDKDYLPVQDENGDEFHYRASNITLADINQYAIKNENLGGDDTDIYVLRLMPTWEYVENPFNYQVKLRWVNALGELNEEYFHGDWRDVLTDWNIENGGLTVKVLRDAVPLLNWIAQHPTYTFWDDINNAIDDEYSTAEEKIEAALDSYAPSTIDRTGELYLGVLAAMLQRNISGENGNDFDRLGNYSYQVNEDNGTIVIWMYENKGGLVFHKDVQDEPFTADDEFYFTVTDVTVDAFHMLNETYKAFPEHVYNANGTERDVLDSDAWLVTFENGAIKKIVKDGVNYGSYFTLKDGEGIRLYVPAGTYTIAELGSKSGGSYKVNVTYTAADGSAVPDKSWEIPDDENLWLRGSKTDYIDTKDPAFNGFPEGVSQVSATVDFEVGEHDVVQTLTFCNQTSSLSIEKELGANDKDLNELKKYQNTEFTFNVSLKLPSGYAPLWDNENGYYFTVRVYSVADDSVVSNAAGRIVLKKVLSDTGDEVWNGTITLKAGQRAVIVMTVPEQADNIVNYWVEEDENIPEELTPMYSGISGQIKPGEQAKAKVTNWYGELPGNGYLAITETGGDPKESFLYMIKDEEGNTLIVSVKGDGETIVECPAGTYEIWEITDWAWRYEDGECTDPPTGTNYAKVTVNGSNTKENPVHADFKNERNDKVWLGGESSKDNIFKNSTNNISALPLNLKKEEEDE